MARNLSTSSERDDGDQGSQQSRSNSTDDGNGETSGKAPAAPTATTSGLGRGRVGSSETDHTDHSPDPEEEAYDLERLVPNKSKYDYLEEDKFFKIVGAKRCPNQRNPMNVSLKFRCLKCQALLSTSDHSIGNLKKHIERLHHQFVNEFANSRKKHRSGDEEKAMQIAMTDLENLKTKKAVMSKPLVSQSQLDEAIVNFVVKDCQTYEVVKKRGGFHDLLQILAPGRKVMSRRTLTRRIQDDFKALKR